MRSVTGAYSHEALAAIVGDDLVLDAEQRAVAAAAPDPESIAIVKQVCGDAVRLLAQPKRRQPVLADAA